MIKKADILERLRTLIGKELTSEHLHEAVFCEEKDKKRLRRFNNGTNSYLQFNIFQDKSSDKPPYAIVTVIGNPNPFRIELEEKDGQMIITSEPKINYYL